MPSARLGNVLVTSAAGQKRGGVPAAARSSPSCRSSTMCPDASGAERIAGHGNAMPVPISWHGRPRRQ
jgi:hypothetical protein